MYLNVSLREHKLTELPTAETVLESFERCCASARKVFQIRKEVMPMFVVICLDGPSHCPAELIIPAPWSDDDQKHGYYDFIKKTASDTKAVAVLMIGECWYSEVKPPAGWDKDNIDLTQLRPASQDPNRKEIVHVVCASTLTEQRNRTKLAYIHRPRGKRPFLGPWERMPNGADFTGELFSLLPMVEA